MNKHISDGDQQVKVGNIYANSIGWVMQITNLGHIWIDQQNEEYAFKEISPHYSYVNFLYLNGYRQISTHPNSSPICLDCQRYCYQRCI